MSVSLRSDRVNRWCIPPLRVGAGAGVFIGEGVRSDFCFSVKVRGREVGNTSRPTAIMAFHFKAHRIARREAPEHSNKLGHSKTPINLR